LSNRNTSDQAAKVAPFAAGNEALSAKAPQAILPNQQDKERDP
jgi:hypothetical protein